MKVSVIICTYNHGHFIRRAVDSTLDQSLNQEDYEIVVINDGSTDETEQILSSYGNQIKLFNNHENKGLVISCNRGITLAKGKYVVRLDADDEIDRNLLLFESAILDANDDIGCVYSDRIEIQENGVATRVILEEFNLFSTIACGIMFRKANLKAIGLYNDLNCEEYDLLMRYLSRYNYYYLRLPLYKYYIHGGNITSDWEWTKVAIKEMIEKWGLEELRKWGYDEWIISLELKFNKKFKTLGGPE